MKKKILMGLGLVAVAAISVNSTVAWLGMETETLVNTMEVGNVSIKQLEYERVVDENGKWVASTDKDKYGYYPDMLQPFTQDKMLVPAVFADGDTKWDDRNGSQEAHGEGSHQQSWGQVGASGSSQLFDDSMKNVIDKFVFVENTGKNNAYVRTWFAFEQGSVSVEEFDKIIATNINGTHWKWELNNDTLVGVPNVEIEDENGVKSTYMVYDAVYLGPKSTSNGILESGKVSYPSLLQLYMMPAATNEDVVALDGNKNGKYDILVVSQAVQADGFDDAETALNAAFGEEHPFK